MSHCFKTGKISYPSRSQAEKARRGFMTRPGVNSDPLNVFCCDHCGGFHLGRNVRQGKTARRKAKPHELAETFGKLNRYKALTQ